MSQRLLQVMFFVNCLPFVFLVSCISQQGVKTIPYRDPNLLIKGMPRAPESYTGHAKGESDEPEIFVKTSSVQIEEKDDDDRGGSLYQPSDRRAEWFRNKTPYQVGDSVEVFVDQNRTQQGKIDKKQDGENKAGDNANDGDKKTAEIEDELLKNFPSLAPEPDSGLSVITRFKAKIVAIKPNGDAVVMMRRSSKTDSETKEYSVRGLLSAQDLQEEDKITTRHLSDVDFYESDGSQVLKSHSSDWQDEYTLRMSGFNESQSKYAAELEDQRKELDQVRKKLRERLEAFGKERSQIATERDDLLGHKNKSAERLQKLESELEQKAQSISDLKSQIRELDDARPGEEQDAEDGE